MRSTNEREIKITHKALDRVLNKEIAKTARQLAKEINANPQKTAVNTEIFKATEELTATIQPKKVKQKTTTRAIDPIALAAQLQALQAKSDLIENAVQTDDVTELPRAKVPRLPNVAPKIRPAHKRPQPVPELEENRPTRSSPSRNTINAPDLIADADDATAQRRKIAEEAVKHHSRQGNTWGSSDPKKAVMEYRQHGTSNKTTQKTFSSS